MERRQERIFFNDTETTEIYTLSLHDALPILPRVAPRGGAAPRRSRLRGGISGVVDRPLRRRPGKPGGALSRPLARSEEHTSELQSRQYLVCRLLLEKKKHIIRSYQRSMSRSC